MIFYTKDTARRTERTRGDTENGGETFATFLLTQGQTLGSAPLSPDSWYLRFVRPD